ncbi:MAG: phosphoadenylyl-sulfate reductase [Planctomycetaceae bacterium]|nr:phosphoadenylyl-sulfate reductase [Planctomycetaceae bacterium]
MPMLTQADLQPLNQTFEERTPEEILRWASEVFGTRVAALSAMQMAGSTVCHMISRLKLDIPIVFVDTGVNFQETLETRDRVGREYGLEIVTLMPRQTMEEQTKERGILYLTPEGQKECCHLRKTEPLYTVRGRYDAMIGSLRRADGGRRDRCPFLMVDTELHSVRINPLANMTDEELDAYIAQNEVIVNPLHHQGFSTIGCNRCTTPVLPNEPKRAGRWRHLGPWSVYCGINPNERDEMAALHIDLPQEVIDKLLGRTTDFAI